MNERKTEKYFTYGSKKLRKINLVPFKVDAHSNKIRCIEKSSFNQVEQSGLWGCIKNEYYSDWTVLTFTMPFLVAPNTIVSGFEYEIDYSNILILDSKNYVDYMEGSLLDTNKLKGFDGILYTKDLVENVKEFESYYFESIQIFNSKCIKQWNTVDMDASYILSDNFKEYAQNLFKKVRSNVQKTNVYKRLLSKSSI